jgi:uncharacterized protein YggE
MKIKSILFMLLAIPAFVSAQESSKRDHFIEVTGTAELEIEPNEIYVVVRLKEFEEGRQKVLIEKLDKDFLTAMDAAGINRNQLSLADAGVQLGRLRWLKKDVFREKTYQVKLTSAAQLEKFIDKIEGVKIDYADVARLHHSEYEKLKLDLKVKALQIAKTKAETLLKSIGSELGKPILIQEINLEPFNPGYLAGNTLYKMKSENVVLRDIESKEEESGIAFKKIRLQMQVNAQFEIK